MLVTCLVFVLGRERDKPITIVIGNAQLDVRCFYALFSVFNGTLVIFISPLKD
jgi:hypothetical protein